MLSFCSLTLQKVPLSYSAPAPNVPASPSSRAPSRRQRVQRLRQFFVAEDSFKDSSPLFRLGDFAHAGCPFPVVCNWRGSPHSVCCAALRASSGPSPADIAVTVCFKGMPFFSARGQKKERGS